MKLTEEQQQAIKGVRVDGDLVIIKMNGGAANGNDNARQLCGDLLKAMNEAPPRG